MKFRCLRCGHSCRDGKVPLWNPDIDALLKVMSPTELAKNCCWSDLGVLQILQIDGRCPFLSDANRCTVYSHRPLACRAFPANREDKPPWCHAEGNYTRSMLKAARDELIEKRVLVMMGRDIYYIRFIEAIKSVSLTPKEIQEWQNRVDAAKDIHAPIYL